VLKTLGLVGTGAAAGALGGTAATQEARAADTSVGQIGSDGSPVDVALDQLRDPGGDEVFDVDDSGDIVSQRGFEFPAVTTNSVNDGRSGRVGDTVYFDARDTGPYVDGQDALSNVPAGGTLLLASTSYDVATQGRLVTDRGVLVEGLGWSQDENGNIVGTKIVNKGGDTVDAPAVEITGTSGNRESAAGEFGGFVVNTDAPNSPGVLIDDVTRAPAKNIAVICDGGCPVGMKWSNSAFFGRAHNCWVSAPTDKAFYVENGPGSDHLFYNCMNTTGGNAGTIGIHTEREGTTVIGGQIEGKDSCIRFDNPTSSIFDFGGLVMGTLHETDATTVIDLDGSNSYTNNVTVIAPQMLKTGTLVNFGKTANSEVLYPQVADTANTELATWSTDAQYSGVAVSRSNANGSTVTDNGAKGPYVHVPGALSDSDIGQLPTGVPVWVANATDHESVPAVYDPAAGSWKHLASATTSFTP
jgi:hypothetical protein